MTTQGSPPLGERGAQVKDAATEQGAQVAQTAKEQGGQVAQTAKEQASNVVEEAKGQARDLAGELRTQVQEQTATQRDRLVSTLRELGEELQEMADGGRHDGIGSSLARQAAGRVRSTGDYLDGSQAGDLLDEVRAFARRRPGAFLLAAGAAGVLTGRLTRGAKAATSDSTSDSATGSTTPRTGYTGGYADGGYAAGGYTAGAATTGYAATTGTTTTDPYADPYADPAVSGPAYGSATAEDVSLPGTGTGSREPGATSTEGTVGTEWVAVPPDGREQR